MDLVTSMPSDRIILQKTGYNRILTKYGDDDEEELEICVICHDDIELGQLIKILMCGHWCHRECINEWLLQKNVYSLCGILL